MKIIKTCLFQLCLTALLVQTAKAGDAYYNLPISSLTITSGELPSGKDTEGRGSWRWRESEQMSPYAVLDGGGEAYVTDSNAEPWRRDGDNGPGTTISICAPEKQAIVGSLYLPKDDGSGMTQVRFKVAASTNAVAPELRTAFYKAKERHYRTLFNQDIPGAAWFRHQAQAAAQELGTNRVTPDNRWRRNFASELESTYDIFTGGRAMSENLQLDRLMALRNGTNTSTVALTNLTGITIKAMDWKALIAGAKPELDPLARFVPADQHAMFFPSFQALVDMTDEADANGTPVLQLFEPRAEDAKARDRYQKQLCLGLNELSRLLGPQVVASAAFTGSDPYLRVGTDVAVLFEAKNAVVLQANVTANQAAARKADPRAQAVSGDIEGVHYNGVVTPDRTICSYMASVSNVVLVSNSKKQLETLICTALGKKPSLDTQEEYLYFRKKYPRNDQAETAFLVLTDPTIRRWCSPQWRIADSRRTRAAAVMADLQAGHLDELVRNKVGGEALKSDFLSPDLGKLELVPAGVSSANYGSLNFMTPISELTLDTVTKDEAAAYERWRDGYQNNWSQFFDPVAVRFSISKSRLATELTVMPLILASRYNDLATFTANAKLGPDAGDPHTNAIARLGLAVDSQSQPIQEMGNFVGNMAPGLKANFLGWLGQSIAVYADESAFWKELSAATNTDAFMQHSYARLPIALRCDVKNPLGAAAFLAAIHAFVDQSAPQMTTWNNLNYQGKSYVKVAASKTAAEANPDANWSVYYAVTPESLTVTLNEDMLKQAIDRQIALNNTNTPAAPNATPWLGGSLGLQLQKRFVDILGKIMHEEYQSHLQTLSWNNLPILNEWKRLYPDQDPVKLHEQYWGVKLLCPGGGKYVWNEKWHTMESTVFGHPAQPKPGSNTLLPELLNVNAGLTFENGGLSAKGVMERNAK